MAKNAHTYQFLLLTQIRLNSFMKFDRDDMLIMDIIFTSFYQKIHPPAKFLVCIKGTLDNRKEILSCVSTYISLYPINISCPGHILLTFLLYEFHNIGVVVKHNMIANSLFYVELTASECLTNINDVTTVVLEGKKIQTKKI